MIVMYDALTTRYTFSCPARGETRVRLSAFRALDRLPGAGHPAVFQVVFDCPCGCEHPGLVSDVELDWAPLGHSSERFLNLMTASVRVDRGGAGRPRGSADPRGGVALELLLLPGGRPRPVFPSSFFLLAPGDGLARARRSLPGLRARLGQPRHAGARRPPVSQRPRDRRPAARASPAMPRRWSRSSATSWIRGCSTPGASTWTEFPPKRAGPGRRWCPCMA